MRTPPTLLALARSSPNRTSLGHLRPISSASSGSSRVMPVTTATPAIMGKSVGLGGQVCVP